MLEDDKAAGKPPRASIEQLIAMRAGVKSEQEAAMLKVLSGK